MRVRLGCREQLLDRGRHCGHGQIGAGQVDADHLAPDRRLGLDGRSAARDAALLTRTETGPKASSAAATVGAQSASLVTSRREKIA
jgi:hypothetical protein